MSFAMGERVLRAIVQQGLTLVQQDPVLLKMIIQEEVDPSMQDEILNYLTQREVAVRLGFAHEPWETPQISIVLASESEQRFLGDEQALYDVILSESAQLAAGLALATNPPFDLPITNVIGVIPAKGRIQIDGEQLTYDSQTPTSLHVAGRHVRRTTQAAHAVGAPIKFLQLHKDIGSDAISNYRLDVLADNADVVLWLQAFVKSVLFLRWDDLDDAGFGEMQISGSDFMPRPQFYPMHVYMRSLSFQARYGQWVPQSLVEALSLETFPTITGTLIVPGFPEIPLGH